MFLESPHLLDLQEGVWDGGSTCSFSQAELPGPGVGGRDFSSLLERLSETMCARGDARRYLPVAL